jgi:hypothetical protein
MFLGGAQLCRQEKRRFVVQTDAFPRTTPFEALKKPTMEIVPCEHFLFNEFCSCPGSTAATFESRKRSLL